MAVLISVFLSSFASFSLLVSATQDRITITAKPGETITLPCNSTTHNILSAVEWIRPDQKPEYVLLYRDDQSDSENQHPSFKNRVELKNEEIKNGDVSLVLKDVKLSDTGTYECHVVQNETKRRKRSSFDTDPITIIILTVERNKHVGLVSFAIFVVVSVVIMGIIVKRRRLNNSDLPPDETKMPV